MPPLSRQCRMPDAWDKFLADCQACIKTRVPKRTAVITVRLHIENGELIAWAPPSVQKWHTEEQPWMDRHMKE